MKILSWNLGGRSQRVEAQVAIISGSTPDIVVLQEVTKVSVPFIRTELARIGLIHAVDGFQTVSATDRPTRYRLMIASRFTVSTLRPNVIDAPWPESVLSVEACTERYGRIQVHGVHVPAGSIRANGWIKVETLESIYRGLARPAGVHRVLCGDFNLPQEEHADGTVMTWAQRRNARQEIVMVRTRFGRPAAPWDAAERSVLLDLASHDLHDVYRSLNGYSQQDVSWMAKRGDYTKGRRFDHIFASRSLRPTCCKYLHEGRKSGASDHSPIMAAFDPIFVQT